MWFQRFIVSFSLPCWISKFWLEYLGSCNPNNLEMQKYIWVTGLPDFLVGTGGWAYFKVPNKPSLKAYSEVFNFVEVNYTFYEYPNTRLVEGLQKTLLSF
jgi:hypothetical protein